MGGKDRVGKVWTGKRWLLEKLNWKMINLNIFVKKSCFQRENLIESEKWN